ncbi:MAG: hypothetical protein VB078_09665 [Clostridiaceae bacterium]|nr:hypothetical protein [Clostridiaceae bacterium]
MFNGKQLKKLYQTPLNAKVNGSTSDIHNVKADTHCIEKQLLLYFQQQKVYAPLSARPRFFKYSKRVASSLPKRDSKNSHKNFV